MSLEIKVPPVGESISEVTLSSWIKKDGDAVEMDEVIAELESDKATFELTAEKAGTLKTIAKEGDTLAIGDVVCTIEEGGAAGAEAKPVKAEKPEAKPEEKASVQSDKASTYAAGSPSPSAAKILAEKGIEPSGVDGSGVGGRITKEDALKAEAGKKPEAAPQAPQKPEAAASAPKVAGARNERREKMS
ncbi:MAG TPA: biotin/lipoyl-containing protein, partial [Sphingobacteriaceae bacterium]